MNYLFLSKCFINFYSKNSFIRSLITLGRRWWLRQWRIHLQRMRPGFKSWVGKVPWRRAWQPTPVFLPGESLWTEEPGGLQPMGSQRVRHNWATKHSTAKFTLRSNYPNFLKSFYARLLNFTCLNTNILYICVYMYIFLI